MSDEPPLILVCNDDGIRAPGLTALAETMCSFGETHIVAPFDEQSAVGHAITVRDPVRAQAWDVDTSECVASSYAVRGTPADCIKLAVNQLLPRRPDLVVSGINRGPNTAVNVIYSGTVSAATEASILGIDAVAFSLCSWESADYEAAARIAHRVVHRVVEDGLPPGILLNVNIPPLPLAEIKGMKVTRQARSRWEESFAARKDPSDRPYYWLTGTFVNLDEREGTDVEAVEDGFVSVTPIQHDLTAYDHLSDIKKWDWDE